MGGGRGLQSQQHACPVLRQVDGPVISPAAQPWCRAQRRKQPGAACCSPVRTHSHGYREILLSSPDPKIFPAGYDFWPPHLRCVSHIHHYLEAHHPGEDSSGAAENAGLQGCCRWQGVFLPPTVKVKLSFVVPLGETTQPVLQGRFLLSTSPWSKKTPTAAPAGKCCPPGHQHWGRAMLLLFLLLLNLSSLCPSAACRAASPPLARHLASLQAAGCPGLVAWPFTPSPIQPFSCLRFLSLLKAGLWHRGKTTTTTKQQKHFMLFFRSMAAPLEIAAVFSKLQEAAKTLKAVQSRATQLGGSNAFFSSVGCSLEPA